MISGLPYTSVVKYNPRAIKYQCCAKKLFKTDMVENNKYFFPLDILNVQREKQKELRNINSKLREKLHIGYLVTPRKLSAKSR